MTVDEAYEYVLGERAAKRFMFGANVKGPMTEEIKRFIVEMYEKSTGHPLLDSKE